MSYPGDHGALVRCVVLNMKKVHYAFQPPQTMMPIPTTATAAPVTSHTVTGTRSTFQSQAIATAT